MRIVTPNLLNRILDGYILPTQGYHGLTHWARVLENGRRVASMIEGADLEILELFAVFHDSRRVNEARDNGHGMRGAQLARELRDTCLELDDERFALLEYACEEHTSGLTEADVRDVVAAVEKVLTVARKSPYVGRDELAREIEA